MNTAASLNSFEAGMTSSSLSPWITEQCGTYDGDVSAGGTAVLECSADDLPVGRCVSDHTSQCSSPASTLPMRSPL